MNKATLDQAEKILSIFKGASTEQIQFILASGLLADVRDANYYGKFDRDAIRALLGLRPLGAPPIDFRRGSASYHRSKAREASRRATEARIASGWKLAPMSGWNAFLFNVRRVVRFQGLPYWPREWTKPEPKI